MVNLVGFGLSAAINGGIAVVVFSIFCYTRMQAANRFVYYPRTFHPAFRGGRPQPPPLPPTFLGWLRPLLLIDRATVIASCGLDAYMFLRFLELCCLLFLGMIPLGVGLLVPLDYTAMGRQDGFEAISVSNLTNNNPRLAAHVIVAYLFAAWSYLLLFLVWLEYRQLRTAWLAQEQLSNRALTVLVQALPETARTDAAFLSTFRSQLPSAAMSASSASTTPPSPRQGLLSGDEEEESTSAIPRVIHSAYVAKNIGKMSDAVSARDSDLHGLEHAALQFEQEPEQRPLTATKCFCCSKQDALTYFPDDMGKQDALLAEGRLAAVSDDSAAYSNGFVTFDSVSAFTAVVNDPQRKPYVVRIAPELRDVYWPSLSYTAGKRLYMSLIVMVLLYLLVFFWIVPVAFTQSIANLQSLADSGGVLSWLSFINDIPAGALGVIDGFLPGLILTIFNIVLPMILYWFSKLEGIEALSWLQFSVVDKFTIFQVINNFFFTTVSTAIMANPSQLFSGGQVVTTLGQSIPQTATFFITYLLFNSFSVFPMMLLNPGSWIVGRLKRRFTVKTPRDLVSVEQASAQNYGTAYPILIFAFIITITFSILAPIVLPFAVLYYGFAYVSYKHQFLYVYNTAFETGGAFWPVICRKLAWCMFSGQIVFTALLGIKEAIAPAVVSAPLIVLPFIFIVVVERRFLRQTEVLPADTAALLDAQRERRRRGGGSRTPFLDESSALRDLGYDQSAVRAMRQGDIVYRHNTCTADKAEEYHRQLLRKQTAGAGGAAGDKDMQKKAAAGGREERKEKTEDVGDDDVPSSSLPGPIAHSSSMSAPAETATSRPVPLQPTSSRRGLGPVEERVIDVGTALQVYHPRYATLQQTLEAANGLGALPPAQDFIQPELLAPPALPLPRQVPSIARDRSLEREPELYDELSDDALERHAGEPGTLRQEGRGGEGREGGAGGAGGAGGQSGAGSQRADSQLESDRMVRQSSSGDSEPDPVQVVLHQ